MIQLEAQNPTPETATLTQKESQLAHFAGSLAKHAEGTAALAHFAISRDQQFDFQSQAKRLSSQDLVDTVQGLRGVIRQLDEESFRLSDNERILLEEGHISTAQPLTESERMLMDGYKTTLPVNQVLERIEMELSAALLLGEETKSHSSDRLRFYSVLLQRARYAKEVILRTYEVSLLLKRAQETAKGQSLREKIPTLIDLLSRDNALAEDAKSAIFLQGVRVSEDELDSWRKNNDERYLDSLFIEKYNLSASEGGPNSKFEHPNKYEIPHDHSLPGEALHSENKLPHEVNADAFQAAITEQLSNFKTMMQQKFAGLEVYPSQSNQTRSLMNKANYDETGVAMSILFGDELTSDEIQESVENQSQKWEAESAYKNSVLVIIEAARNKEMDKNTLDGIHNRIMRQMAQVWRRAVMYGGFIDRHSVDLWIKNEPNPDDPDDPHFMYDVRALFDFGSWGGEASTEHTNPSKN